MTAHQTDGRGTAAKRSEQRVSTEGTTLFRGGARSLGVAITAALASLFCAIMLWPFIAGAGWWQIQHPTIALADWHAVMVSVFCATSDGVLMIIFATPLAWILARKQFPGKAVLEGLMLIFLLTPPLAMGMLLANVLGPESILGRLAWHLDISLTNSVFALIIAGFYAAAPYYLFAARLAFGAVEPGYEDVGRMLGKSPMAIWFGITLPMAAGGLFWALMIGWLRALGEFGVAIIIAYFPHGIPIQMWVNLQDAGPRAVYPLLWMLILVAIPAPLLLGLSSVRRWGGQLKAMDRLTGLFAWFMPRRISGSNRRVCNNRRRLESSIHIDTSIASPIRLKVDFNLQGVTVLTGPTGSGKTTLLRAIAGLTAHKPSPETLAALAVHRIGYAAQQSLLFPHLTVMQNVAFGIRGQDRQHRAMMIIGQFGLEHLAARMPADLSAGQAQMVSVARTMAGDPDVLLLDEPTAALDFEATDALMAILQEMVRDHDTKILMATHDRDIARSADTWLSIKNGKISIH